MLVTVVVVAVGALGLAGWSLVIDRSDSMRPTLRAGDLLVLRPLALDDARDGDILTFPDPGAPGRTLTHRLVTQTPRDGDVLVETRGDANSGSETWLAGPDDVVHTVAVRVPHAGRAVAGLGEPLVRALLLTALITVVTTGVLRRVWSSRG